MKNMKRIFTSLLMALVLVMAMAPAALAAGTVSEIDVTGKTDTFVFSPGSGASSTDLFPNFKNVMPGDTVLQSINVTHKGVGLGKFKLYMRAVPHDRSNLPQEPVLDHEGSVAEMNDFLSQLELKVYKGPNTNVKPIYSGSPDGANQLKDFVFLGEFSKGLKGRLTAELTVPIEMGNEYADRMGEVDWEFMIEEVPPAIIPQTGDTTNLGVLIGVSVLSLAAIIVVVVILLRKKKQ